MQKKIRKNLFVAEITFLFQRTLDKEHGKPAQALLESASECFYHIHWSLPSQLSWKKYLLLTYKILLTMRNYVTMLMMLLSTQSKKITKQTKTS